MQLRRLKECLLLFNSPEKQANGTYKDSYTEIKSYKVIKQELQDEISASIYGANVNKTIRISSIRNELEKYLKNKVGNNQDNVSKYFIVLENKKYKIVSPKENWIDVELIGNYESVGSV